VRSCPSRQPNQAIGSHGLFVAASALASSSTLFQARAGSRSRAAPPIARMRQTEILGRRVPQRIAELSIRDEFGESAQHGGLPLRGRDTRRAPVASPARTDPGPFRNVLLAALDAGCILDRLTRGGRAHRLERCKKLAQRCMSKVASPISTYQGRRRPAATRRGSCARRAFRSLSRGTR
jgi:hypothetical protein